jgi:hypothetical protein
MTLRPILPLLRLVAAAAIVLLAIDVCFFRTGMYFWLIEPESTSGSVVNGMIFIDRDIDPTRKNIVVFGNSQIGEGFSERMADAEAHRPDLHFINGAVAGTSPRVWNYMLRKVDPHAERFAAVALMIDYDVASNKNDLGNYLLDTNYALPLLGIRDVVDFPNTFSDPTQRERARRAIVFPLQALQDDARDFLMHPWKRIVDITVHRQGWLNAVALYPGREAALPDLTIDKSTNMPSAWGPTEKEIRPTLEPYFKMLQRSASPELQAANSQYREEWLERIVSRYREHHIPVIVFVVPRGPWQREVAPIPKPEGAIADLLQRGEILAVPGDAFVDLEEPQFFFDTLHMNRTGREQFSRWFADRVAPLVH